MAEHATVPSRAVTLAIWTAAALSGAAAVAYEVCWSRALVVPLGNSMDAAAILLAGFMLGIAFGARVGGGLSERSRSPLRLYAALEIALGLYAIVAPWLLSHLSAISFVFVRYSIALLLITLPCLAMGAALPLLIRALIGRGRLGHQTSVAYGVNTLGAAFGALATGFWGIARAGVWRSSAIAAGASALAAVLAFLVSFVVVDEDRAQRIELVRSDERLQKIALVVAFVSGFAMLACELLWSRVLTFVFGHDAYAFATLVGVVLVGLAIGGLIHRALARFDQRRVVFVTLGLFAIALIASYWGAAALVVRRGRDPFGIAASGDLGISVWIELYRALAYTPVLVLAPALLSGILFPAACSLYGGGADDAGRKVGIVFLANGIGSALGASFAAFFMVQAFGIQGAFIALAVLSALVAILVYARPVRTFAAIPLVVVIAMALVMPRGLPSKMLLEAVGKRHQKLLYYEEARTGTVSVIENQINRERVFLMNAVNEVTTRLVHDQSFKILGHLGPLLHPNPKNAVMICLGAGLSAGATMVHPLDRLDIVDLSSAVPRSARYFSVENNGVLDDPRMHLHVDDGRQFLLNSKDHYDVAVIDSTHPKAVDSWILYTKEFYDLVRARLADGGIVVQWLPLHGLSEREFKIVVRTFLESFPEMTLWANAGFETYGPVAYAKLVGVKGRPLVVDYASLSARLAEPKMHADLAPYGIATPEEILDLFVAAPDAIRAWTDGLPAQTDDHPIVPYTTVFSSGRRMEPPLLLAVRGPIVPLVANLPQGSKARSDLDAAYESQGFVLAGLLDRAAELRPQSESIRLFVAQTHTTLGYYVALAERYPDDVEKLFEAANQLGALGSPKEAKPLYEKALALRPHDFRVRLNFALLLQNLGETKAALKLLSTLRDEQPASAVVLYNFGAALLSSGDASAARVQLELALAWDRTLGRARLALAVTYLALGELDRADASLREVLADNPWIAEAHDLAGLVAARRGDLDRAIEHHGRAIRLQPHRAVSHYDLGVALQAKGTLDAAALEYAAAIRIEPRYAAAHNNLGLVHAARGRYDEAADAYLQALDADPRDAMAALNLGLARRAQGKNADATSAFCLALQLGPTIERARSELVKLGAKPEDCSK